MMDKNQKINNIAWELLKYPPKDLKAQGIDPLNLVGATFATKDLMKENGKSDNEM